MIPARARAPVAIASLVLAVTIVLGAWPCAVHESAPALELAAMRDEVTTAAYANDMPEHCGDTCHLQTERERAEARRRLAELQRRRDELRREYICRLPRVRISKACLDNPLGKDCL